MPDPRGVYLHDDLILGLEGWTLLCTLLLSAVASRVPGLVPAVPAGPAAGGICRPLP